MVLALHCAQLNQEGLPTVHLTPAELLRRLALIRPGQDSLGSISTEPTASPSSAPDDPRAQPGEDVRLDPNLREEPYDRNLNHPVAYLEKIPKMSKSQCREQTGLPPS